MNTLERIIAIVFILIAFAATLGGEFTLFEGFVGILLGNILLSIRERDA